MTTETTAPAQLQALAKAVAATVDGTMVELKKALSLPDADDAALVKARDEAIVAAAAAIEHAFGLGLHNGAVAKSEHDFTMTKSERLAAILDSVEAISGEALLGKAEGLASDLALWRAHGVALLSKAAKQDEKDAEDEADGGDDEAAEGEDPKEDAGETANKPKGKKGAKPGCKKFEDALLSIKAQAGAIATSAMQKAEDPVPALTVATAVDALVKALQTVPVQPDFSPAMVEAQALNKAGRTFSAANLARFQALQQRLKEIDKEICDMTGIGGSDTDGEGVPGGEGIGTDTNLVTKGEDLSPASRAALLKHFR